MDAQLGSSAAGRQLNHVKVLDRDGRCRSGGGGERGLLPPARPPDCCCSAPREPLTTHRQDHSGTPAAPPRNLGRGPAQRASSRSDLISGSLSISLLRARTRTDVLHCTALHCARTPAPRQAV